MVEYDRSSTISLAQVYEDERQATQTFRPTFKVTYLYANTYTGTTDYLPFQYNLYYINAEQSSVSGTWRGFPQYYEFDFYRPPVDDQHIDYKSKSAYTYNWNFYLSYAYNNNYDKKLTYYTNTGNNINWVAKDGIPFTITNSTSDGNGVIRFECIAPHGLIEGEYVELSLTYRNSNIFQVYSLGNGLFGSEVYIFNVLNIGYTGGTFNNGVTGTFKRVVNPDNMETKSKYYIRENKILTNVNDITVTKAGFEKNVFNEENKFEYSSITPNKVSRISKKTSSNAYNITSAYDLNFTSLKDNQKRPISEIFLTTIFKGYSGYFNQPNNNIGLKQGWEFNITKSANTWWDLNNIDSNTSIPVSGYTRTSGVTKTFYYNQNLKRGDVIDGDFCEWNDYLQEERVISRYVQKIKYNQNVFQTTNNFNTNSPGYYYMPHGSMTIRVFSDYVETGNAGEVDMIPSYSFYSKSDDQFRWRDLYSYGYKDNLNRGVDYPFLNMSQYPYADIIFRLIPEGTNQQLQGVNEPIKPLIDKCE
ncbi:hypothetical protein M1146_04625 [Patescibacteria group bacterium]|nr:hypothetical protein [Patescibacteria group bacterium]